MFKDISLRKPQGVPINRILGCNKEDVQRYFLKLNQLLDENDFSPHQIYNCDETGITTVHKPVKVIAKKGKKSVSSATSGERGGGGDHNCPLRMQCNRLLYPTNDDL